MKYEIGLLKLSAPGSDSTTTLIRSQLKSLRVGQQNKYSFGNLSDWPPELTAQRSSSIFWNFKSDLCYQRNQIRHNRAQWSTLCKYASIRGGQQNISSGFNVSSLNPHQISKAFLSLLCQSVKAKIRNIFGDSPKIKFYFTVPGYSPDRRQQYRDNLRSILEQIGQGERLRDVDFPQRSGAPTEKFLYEQYGVYYYFSRCEQRTDLKKSSANYLIIDIGGSTTDIAVIHLNKMGKQSERALPIFKSFTYGGSDLNRTIIEKNIHSNHYRGLTDDQWDEALHKIEEVKLKILKNRQEEVIESVSLGRPIFWRINYQKIKSAFAADWQSKVSPAILEVLKMAEQDGRFKRDDFFCIDGILLAGGGTKPDFFRQSLENDPKLHRYFSNDCQIISAEKADPSSLASIGLGISIAERRSQEFRLNSGQHGELNQAEIIHYRILNSEGKPMSIHRRQKPEEFLMSIDELRENSVIRNRGAHFDLPYSWFTQETTTELPENVRLQFWTDCNSTVNELNISLTRPNQNNIGATPSQDLMFGSTTYTSSREVDPTKVRIKPHFFQWLPDKRRPARCDREDSQKIDISLLPQAIEESETEDNIYVCIDFGMSNTSVAVLAPHRHLNEQDFDVLKISLPEAATTSEPSQVVNVTVPITAIHSRCQVESAFKAVEIETQFPASQLSPLSTVNDETISSSSFNQVNTTDIKTEEKAEELKRGLTQPPKSISDSSSDLIILGQALATLTQDFQRYAQQTTNAIEILAKALSDQATSSAATPLSESSVISSRSEPLNSPPLAHTPNFDSFQRYVEQKGYRYESSVLSSIWAQANNPKARLTVLAGPPGSGKTALVRLLAQYFNQDLSGSDDFNRVYLLEAVLPSWFSSENLMGFYDQIQGKFRPTAFLKFVQDAKRSKSSNRKCFVCLDEFNLAQPEQYLAKVLSTIESSDKKVVVCQDTGEEIEFTDNLKLFATINTDAASRTLSPKVLDRSMLVRILPTKAGIIRHAKAIEQDLSAGRQVFNVLLQELDLLFDLSCLANTVFGYRTLDSIASYIASHPFSSQANSNDQLKKTVVDSIISSYFLSKLPGLNQFGEYREYSQKLEQARNHFSSSSFEISELVVKKIIDGFPGQSAF